MSANRTDQTPAWLRALGIRAGEWQTIPKAQLRELMHQASTPEQVRVWCCGMLHSFGFRGQRAVILRAGYQRPLTPADIAAEAGISKQQVRRALACLEDAGLAYRSLADGRPLQALPLQDRRRLNHQVRISFYAQPHKRDRPKPDQHPPAPGMWILHRMGLRPEAAPAPRLQRTISTLYNSYLMELDMVRAEYRHYFERLLRGDEVGGDGYFKKPPPATETGTKPLTPQALAPTEMKGNERGDDSPFDSDISKTPKRAGRPRERKPASPPAGGSKSQSQEDLKVAELRETLSREFTRHFGIAPTLKQTREIHMRAGGASIDQLVTRIRNRPGIRSWAGVFLLAEDCAASKADWDAGAPERPHQLDRLGETKERILRKWEKGKQED